MELNDSIFEGFGSNWQWATIDYRGVARVHTWQPGFSATGRILIPLHAHNSEPREAFNVVELPEGWTPLIMRRDMSEPMGAPTDRFGVNLPRGVDLMAAADVKIEPTALFEKHDEVEFQQSPTVKVKGTFIAFDGSLYVIRVNGGYVGAPANKVSKPKTEFEQFEIKLQNLLCWGNTQRTHEDAKKLFNAGCRL